jgi:eukaryotic-like serine/threonine-protein kinase
MGEVYRAHDVPLGRDVAIKILLRAFTTDPERLARFEREARLVAALNHPHIAGIHGITETGTGIGAGAGGGTDARRSHQSRPSTVEEALTIGRQIADALSAAHDKGIVHRDLRPANVTLMLSGAVKILDFGLAKPDPDSADPHVAHSPTITISATHNGLILGTAAYMSPEQARGKSVDKRSDIWAFGCVLFEMLTGHKAFDRDTVSDTMAAILEREPDWRLLPAATPPTRCLAARRPRDIGDARLELDDAVARFGSHRPLGRVVDFVSGAQASGARHNCRSVYWADGRRGLANIHRELDAS